MSPTPFLLSHHLPRDYGRCVRIGGLRLCARCLGTYPLMVALIALQGALRAPGAWRLDPWLAFVLPLPALIDWARGRFDPRTGTNLVRLATGALLGGSLARTLYLHLRRPPSALLITQLLLLGTCAIAVELLVRRRARKASTDPESASRVQDRDGSDGAA